MALTKRVEVLFDPRQYALLEQIARSRQETVGAMVRQAVEQQLLQPTLEERRAAIRGLLGEEPIDFGEWEDVKKSIEQEITRHFEAS
ncbi:MAG: hypothetical protein HYU30_01695 [Chloroflexi bacterium]|nr:hypothetical protein [Chloroflexota bacterium]